MLQYSNHKFVANAPPARIRINNIINENATSDNEKWEPIRFLIKIDASNEKKKIARAPVRYKRVNKWVRPNTTLHTANQPITQNASEL